VTVKSTEDLLATLQLSPANSSISLGATTSLTPTFTWTGGTITKSVVNDDSKDISVSSGTPTLNTARAGHTSILLSNDDVLVLGTYLQTGGTTSLSTDLWTP
jgi:archaellum component FlaF (FlaF/FlaG flagellin family)